MIPGLVDWKQAICEILACGYNIQPSEFWEMDLIDLNFWRKVVKIINESTKRQMNKK